MLPAMQDDYARAEAEVRAHDKDRYLANDLATAKAAVLDGTLSGAVQTDLFS